MFCAFRFVVNARGCRLDLLGHLVTVDLLPRSSRPTLHIVGIC